MKNLMLVLMPLLIAATMILPKASFAEPYIAQRLGQKCSVCHTNMTGGGKRTAAGLAFGNGLTENVLTSQFSGQLNERIGFGADFRASYQYTAFSDPETVGGVTGDTLRDTSSFNIDNGVMYGEFSLSDNLLFYLDQQVAPEGGRTREALLIYKGLMGEHSYLKAGRFYLPYGIRLEDDTAFIRQYTGFNFDNSDIGVELGYEPGPFSFALAVTNGTQGAGENNGDKQVSLLASIVQHNYRFGVSYSHNNGVSGLGNTSIGAFAGVTVGDLVLLGEYSYLEQVLGLLEVEQEVMFLSANYLLQPSLNLKVAYDFFDPNSDVEENEQTRYSVILEKFVNQYFQVRAGVRAHQGIPQNTLDNRTLIFSELHLYF